MPYTIKELPGGRFGIFKMVKGQQVQVAESKTRDKAEASVRIREEAAGEKRAAKQRLQPRRLFN